MTGLPSGLSALGYRDYRLIWIGQVISNVGSSMQQLGLGWLIAERDGAPQLVPVYLGLVGLARGIPVLFAGLAGCRVRVEGLAQPAVCVELHRLL